MTAPIGLTSVLRPRRLHPHELATARTLPALFSRVPELEAELARGIWTGTIAGMRPLTSGQRLHAELAPVLDAAIDASLRQHESGEVLEGAARRLFCALGVVPAYTPLIVRANFQSKMLHLRVEESDEKTICGIPIGVGWRRSSERESFTDARIGTNQRVRAPETACLRCAAKHELSAAGREKILFEVLTPEERVRIRTATRAAIIRHIGSSTSEVNFQTWREFDQAGREGAVGELHLIAIERALELDPAWMLDLWFDGRQLEPMLRAAYPQLEMPSKQTLLAALTEGELEHDARLLWQPYKGGASFFADRLIPRVVHSHWPLAAPLIAAHFADYKYPPLFVKKLAELAAA